MQGIKGSKVKAKLSLCLKTSVMKEHREPGGKDQFVSASVLQGYNTYFDGM
jgi:hypothetical protein